MTAYSQAKEFSTTLQQHLDLGLGMLDKCLAFNRPTAFQGHVLKLESIVDRLFPQPTGTSAGPRATDLALTASDIRENRAREARSAAVRRSVWTKIKVAKGLILLSQEKFEETGLLLSEVIEDGGLGDWDGQALSTADLALIVTVCTLATGRRSRLRQELLEKAQFRACLDDSQSWIVELLRAVIGAKYGEATQILSRAQVNPSANDRDQS